MSKIIRNSAKCLKCGDEIESTHVHDFKWCSCKNIAVDGGKEYIKRCGDIHGTLSEDTSIFEKKPAMPIDQFQDYLNELVAGAHPSEMERDNQGQLIIYTGIYQHSDGTLHDEAEDD